MIWYPSSIEDKGCFFGAPDTKRERTLPVALQKSGLFFAKPNAGAAGEHDTPQRLCGRP
jgi:hypothetical protein